jgi:hypothetical protein
MVALPRSHSRSSWMPAQQMMRVQAVDATTQVTVGSRSWLRPRVRRSHAREADRYAGWGPLT